MLGPLVLTLSAAAMVPPSNLGAPAVSLGARSSAQQLVAAGTPVGPPAPHLDVGLARQWQLSDRASWRGFRAQWGGAMRWNPTDATPHFWYGSGVAAEQADLLVADLAKLAGVDPSELSLAHKVVHGVEHTGQSERTLLRWDRTWRGAPVQGDQILVVVVAGHIAGAWVRLTPITLDQTPAPGELVLPVPQGQGRRTVPALVREELDGSQTVYVDRDGRELYRFENRRYATGQVSYLERTTGDDMMTAAARHVTVTDTTGAEEITDDDGVHDLSGTVDVLLDGDVLGVTVAGRPAGVSDMDADFTIVGGDDVVQSAATVQHHFHVVWDWLADRWPSHAWLGSYVPADVEIDGSCNAYYTGGTLNFYRATPGVCVALGEIADVVYHETGHGIHEYIMAGGTWAGDISEGSSDFISATILGDPVLAPNAWGEGTYIRELDTDKVYPRDLSGEVHNDGLIWGSFLWDLRTQWIADYGETDGVELTDVLFLGALEQGPTLTDVAEAVLLSDDDNGDLTDGTPHACQLVDLLDVHGLGPGSIGVVYLDLPEIGPQASDTDGYPVDASIYNLTADCSGLDEDSITLWYTIDEDLVPPDMTEADPLDGLSAWSSVPLVAEDDTTWSAAIPRQPANAHVRYLVTMASTDGTQVVASHDGDADAVRSFWVGDRQQLWCEDFETGAKDWLHGTGLASDAPPLDSAVDEWQVGSPTGEGAWDPTAAYAGESIAAVDLAGDYEPNTRLYLESPWVDLGDTGLMLLLSYQRWLTVEDGLYDVAQLSIGGSPVWENRATSGGETHHLDLDWTLQDVPLAGLVDADGGVELSWTLRSDQGLEYGGWQLDDVCVEQLDDPPAHYRRIGLTASTDGTEDVTLAWTDPWITPLTSSILVARQDDWPTGIDDGRIVAVDFAAHWGTAHTVVDTSVLPGESWYYAFFAAGADTDDWQLDVVEGENGVVGSVMAEAVVDTGDTGGEDTATTADGGTTVDPGDGGTGGTTGTGGDAGADAGGKDTGCAGCSGVPGRGGVGVWLGLLAAVGMTRRRRSSSKADADARP